MNWRKWRIATKEDGREGELNEFDWSGFVIWLFIAGIHSVYNLFKDRRRRGGADLAGFSLSQGFLKNQHLREWNIKKVKLFL
jgi:hypothetical protein